MSETILFYFSAERAQNSIFKLKPLASNVFQLFNLVWSKQDDFLTECIRDVESISLGPKEAKHLNREVIYDSFAVLRLPLLCEVVY